MLDCRQIRKKNVENDFFLEQLASTVKKLPFIPIYEYSFVLLLNTCY